MRRFYLETLVDLLPRVGRVDHPDVFGRAPVRARPRKRTLVHTKVGSRKKNQVWFLTTANVC